MPPAYSISCGVQCPAKNTGSSHSSAATRTGSAARTARRTRSIRRAASSTSATPASLLSVRLGQRADVAERLAQRVRVEREDLGRRVHPPGERLHVVVGDGAHRAQRLGDDEVRGERAHAVLVELVDRAALLGELAHGAVDLAGREARADDVARDLGQVERLRRVVALVRDGGDLAAQAQGEERLGGRGDEGDDAHAAQYERGRIAVEAAWRVLLSAGVA